MKSISRYRRKQLLYLTLIFTFFTAIVIFLQYYHEKRYRINALNNELEGYTVLINNYIGRYLPEERSLSTSLDSLISIFPDINIRTTIIDLNGKVLFDTEVKNTAEMENHIMRPEIQNALTRTTGSDIRTSVSTGIKYYYFARKFEKYFIRMSVEYNIEARKIIEPDKISILLIILLFFITSLILIFVTDKFGESISSLRKFTHTALANKPIDDNLTFPESELGNIGQDIVGIYQKLNTAKHELISEKEKLMRHLNLLDQGIAIFSSDKKLITSNSHFIQYINYISDSLVHSTESFFTIPDFSPLIHFIDSYSDKDDTELIVLPSHEITIQKNTKYYTAKCMVFQDKSFEIIIQDNTKPAKRKLMKQQLTENIAHELKTPVSSIKGFLETILESNLDKTRQLDFIRRAYSQTLRLTNLINDISMLSKIEEARNLYPIEKVNLYSVITSVMDDLQALIKENRIEVELNIPENTELKGNPVLLYSIFRNLFDNVISYAGDDITVKIDKYMEDPLNYYFSFSDTGTGVPEQDIPRLFERFYRVDKGRDRKSGGTGLGLSIVKNAILYHKGEITVKNRKEGGLEFLFSINRNLI